MEPTRRNLLGTAAGAITIALAGCTGDSNDTDQFPTATTSPTDQPGTPTATPTSTAPQTTTGGGSTATVRTRSHPDHGTILVDSEGMTLYMFDSDTQGEGASTCSGDCASAWPPLTVEGTPTKGSGVEADLSTFERDDGGTQVSAGGWPLYYFDSDEEPGDVNGQGVNGVWWVLGPDGTPKRPDSTATTTGGGSAATVRTRSHPDHGTILVDSEGMTLYMFDSDTQGEGASTCSGDCASAWPPLTVEGTPTKGSGVEADLSTFERDGGGTQVSAGGWPLYYFASDEEPGDANGQGVNGVWWVLAPDGTPKRSGSNASY